MFIAGDACHTHSPKAGQGMNVSMGDAFNLGWKLASVVRGQCRPEILHTYSSERHAVAKELIDFDREFAAMFSAAPSLRTAEDGVDPAEFQRYFQQSWSLHGGHGDEVRPIRARRRPARISTSPRASRSGRDSTRRPWCASPMPSRCISVTWSRRMDAGGSSPSPMNWHRTCRVRASPNCASLLAADSRSPLLRYRSDEMDVDAVVDLRAVVQQGHDSLVIGEMPSILRPNKGRYGLVDYEKVFCPDVKAGQDIFEMRGVDRASGAIVVVRPDQHVAHVLPLDGFDELVEFFAGFMVPVG